jgi:pentatricopeptide repeat protein
MSPVSAENNGRTRQKRATGRKVDPLVKRLLDMKREVQHHLKTNNLSDALRILSDMMTFVGYTPQTNSTTAYNNNKTHTSAPQIRKGSNQRIHMDSSLVVDETIRLVTNRAFTSPFGGQQAVERVHIGFQAIEMQLSCECALSKPYNTVPRWTLLRALMALTALRSNDVRRMERHFPNFNPSLQAFRILQRLITGGGVRESLQPGFTNLPLDERDFSMVLNSFVNDGKMDMAHKVVALQERTEHAPPLSPVAYSILIKGYGRSHDIENVKMILSHADSNGVIADTIMLNSVIDAYVNCDCVDEATRIFNSVRYSQTKDLAATRSSKEVTSSYPSAQLNQRTYNTILKGFAKVGDLTQALKLSNEMRRAGLWDDITTNTLVNAAVTASKFDIASKILRNCTSSYQPNESKTRMGNYRRGKEHPNIEAYTELLDGYGKAGMTDKAIGVLKLMQERGVEPNEITFTCAIGALARDKRISQAKKMLEYMEKTGVRATSVTYNTFIAGLVADPPTEDDKDGINNNGEAAYAQYNKFVSEALILTGKMIENRVMPNAITISVLVDAMGRCNPPRMGEAQLLVKELDKKKILPLTNERVATSLIKICGRCGDIQGASESFQMIENPDVIALNAFLDACCRVGNLKLAFNTFKEYAAKETHRSTKLGNRQIEPDVITYSVLLSALFSLNTNTAAKRARILYRDMKRQGISADIGLVDV